MPDRVPFPADMDRHMRDQEQNQRRYNERARQQQLEVIRRLEQQLQHSDEIANIRDGHRLEMTGEQERRHRAEQAAAEYQLRSELTTLRYEEEKERSRRAMCALKLENSLRRNLVLVFWLAIIGITFGFLYGGQHWALGCGFSFASGGKILGSFLHRVRRDQIMVDAPRLVVN